MGKKSKNIVKQIDDLQTYKNQVEIYQNKNLEYEKKISILECRILTFEDQMNSTPDFTGDLENERILRGDLERKLAMKQQEIDQIMEK